MKKHFFYLLSVLMLWSMGGIFIACSDDDDNGPAVVTPEPPVNSLTMKQKEWTFSGEADEYAIAVFANVSWKVSCDADWCTLDKKEGTGNEVFSVSVPANTTGLARTATIIVKAVEDATLIQNFKITQEAGVLNITSEESVEVPAAGQTVVIDVESDMDYTFEMGEWVTVAAAPSQEMSAYCAVTRSKITLNIAANLGYEERKCEVEIKAGGEVKKTVRIKQAAMPVPAEVMEIDITNAANAVVEMPSVGGMLQAKVKANVSYDCSLAGWMSWDGQMSAVGEANQNGLSIRVLPNLDTDRRTELKFTWKENGEAKEKIVTVYQKAIVFSFTTVTPLPYAGGESEVLLKADNGEGVLSVELLADGVIFAEGSTPDFGTLKVKKTLANLLANELRIPVTAKFKHNRYNCSVIKHFTLIQEACPLIRIEGDKNIEVGVEAGSRTFTVIPPFEGAKWDVEIVTIRSSSTGQGIEEVECEWAEVKKKGNDFTVTWNENTQAKEQKATVRVSLKGTDSNKASIELVQEKADVPEFTQANNIKMLNHKAVEGYDLVIEFTPKNYWCTAELVTGADFITLSPTSTCEGGSFRGSFNITENTAPDLRTATFQLKLYKNNGDTEPVLTKTITLTQPGKPAVTKVTAEVNLSNGGTNILNEKGSRPVTVIVTGATEVKWVMENGTNAGWLLVETGGSGYWLYNRGQRAGTYTVYVIPADAEFDSANVDNYGKIELVIK